MPSSPLYFPVPTLVPSLPLDGARPLASVLEDAGVPCRASGHWTHRPVIVERVAAGKAFIEREPGDWGAVRIGVPSRLDAREQARYAAAAMAYGVMDLVARQSLSGVDWARPSLPRGRPSTGRALTGAERQRLYRQRMAAEGGSAG